MISPAGQELLRKVPVQAVPAPQAAPPVLLPVPPGGPGAAAPMKIHSMDRGFPAVLTAPGQQRSLREAVPPAGPPGAAALQAAGK